MNIGTPEFRELERLRERARHNEAAALRHARDEGMQQVAKNLKGMGISVEKIVGATGLSVEEINCL